MTRLREISAFGVQASHIRISGAVEIYKSVFNFRLEHEPSQSRTGRPTPTENLAMPTFLESRDANAAFNPSYVPVMVVTGATAGIGQAMLEALAKHLKGRIHIVLVGRNRAAAEAIIAGLPPSPESKYEFIECDVLLMKNVHALAADLLKRLPKINFLVHCAGSLRFFGSRKETEEGIDDMFAIRYYNRFALTKDL
ncbi:NAD(P)-binding protein, partial [Pholiota conissans]